MTCYGNRERYIPTMVMVVLERGGEQARKRIVWGLSSAGKRFQFAMVHIRRSIDRLCVNHARNLTAPHRENSRRWTAGRENGSQLVSKRGEILIQRWVQSYPRSVGCAELHASQSAFAFPESITSLLEPISSQRPKFPNELTRQGV